MPRKLPKQTLKKGKIQRGFSPKYEETPVEEKELKQGKKSLVNKIENELELDGIKLFDNENIIEDFLRLPADLTEVTSKDLGRYFTTFTKQKLWVRTLLGRTSAILRELEEDLDDIRDNVYSMLPQKMSIKEKELNLRRNEKAKELLKEFAYMQEKKNMLNAYLENLEDAIVCVSREITRRENDWKEENRENNLR